MEKIQKKMLDILMIMSIGFLILLVASLSIFGLIVAYIETKRILGVL